VSDRTEKETLSAAIIVRLEAGGEPVVGQDWRRHITRELQEGGAAEMAMFCLGSSQKKFSIL